MNLIDQIKSITQLIGDSRIEKLNPFTIKGGLLKTPLAEDTLSTFGYRSKRANRSVDMTSFERLLTGIKELGAFKGLNHIGFCYKVDSKQDELKRVMQSASKKQLHVYQEPSIDDADWLFVGDIAQIDNPLLELLPVEGIPTDPWVDYYLPHIQFDIDTKLSPDEIMSLVQKHMPQPGSPYSIKIDDITYIQRVNLGCIEGMNLMLDISTNNRDINYRKSWKKLV